MANFSKFFTFEELLSRDKGEWLRAFEGGDFAVFRLTPEKYHYNHTPVAGRVVDFYAIDGAYHSCNPGAVMTQRHLLREVWGPSHSDQSHYLRIYMGRLRRKLEVDPARPQHFTTETGIGYRFVLDR